MSVHRCRECGEKHESLEELEEHHSLHHPGKEFVGPDSKKTAFMKAAERAADLTPYRFVTGFLVGFLVCLTVLNLPGILASQQKVDFTVVTCENCSYDRFRTVSGELFEARFTEVDHRSSRGIRLIEKYNLNYVPGFIIEKEVENHENFSQIRGSVVEFEDAYVLSDRGNEVAQRFSSGRSVEEID